MAARRRLAALGASLGLALVGFASVKRGDPLPSMTLRDGGKRLKLAEITGDGSLVLLSPAAVLTSAECASLIEARRKLAGDRVKLVVVTTSETNCTASKEGLFMVAPAGDVSRLFGEHSGGETSWLMVIADPFKTVRHLAAVPASANAIAALVDTADNWEGGRQIFSGACGHCHGDDGADTSYVGIKTLAGISQRLSREAILDGGRQFGAVDMTGWSSETKAALLLYIEGL
jgi:cytochrome c553